MLIKIVNVPSYVLPCYEKPNEKGEVKSERCKKKKKKIKKLFLVSSHQE